MEIEKEWIETILCKTTCWGSISKVVDLHIFSGLAKGENYGSDMCRVLVDVLLDSGKHESISLIVKSLPSTESWRAVLSELGLFPREIYMYRDIVPNMAKLLEEIGDTSETVWCRCIDYTPYESLVLEDLSVHGYKIVDKLKGFDLEHSKLAICALAKFHAMSVVLRERELIPLDIFGKGIYENSKEMANTFHENMLNQFLEKSKESWGVEWDPILARFEEKMRGRMSEFLDMSTYVDDSDFRVLCHGDCWHNNILFKYDESGQKPLFVKFIDFQACAYQLPARDLQYFLNTSTSVEVRATHHEELVLLYHKELIRMMALFKCETEAPSEKKFVSDMHRLDIYGLTTTFMALPFMVVEKPDVVPDMEEFCKSTKETKQYDTAWAFKSTVYQNIMKTVLTKAVDKGLI